jgi:hypothetical protein
LVSDLAERPGDVVIDVLVAQQWYKYINRARVLQLAEQMHRVVPIRSNLFSEPPPWCRQIARCPRNPLSQRPIRPVRQHPADRLESTWISQAREDERRIAARMSVVSVQPRFQFHQDPGVAHPGDLFGHLELPPEHRRAPELAEQICKGGILLTVNARAAEQAQGRRRGER